MATERNFITPDGMVVQTTANVVGNTTSVDMFANTQRALSQPSYSMNFRRNPRLDPRFIHIRASSATYVGANGIITTAANNVPRFEYDPVTLQCKGLLSEEGRTNYFTYSTPSETAGWSGYQSGIGGITNLNFGLIANAGIAPDGTNTATFFYHKSANHNYDVIYPGQFPVQSLAHWTQSIFIKANTIPVATSLYISHYDTTDSGENLYMTYTPSTNAFAVGTGANCQIVSGPSTQDYPNGWKRIYFTFRYLTGTQHGLQFKHAMYNPPAANQIGANGVGIYLWGAQLEQGSFVTSLIPTSGAQATRVGEYAYTTDLGFKNENEMTVVCSSASVSYLGNTTSGYDFRYNTNWHMRNNNNYAIVGAANTPYYGIWQAVLNGNSMFPVNAMQTYMAWTTNANNDAAYQGFAVYPINLNQTITNATYVTTAVVLKSNNWGWAAGGTVNYTNAYEYSKDLNYFQLGTVNGYLGSITIYPRQLSNTELANITL